MPDVLTMPPARRAELILSQVGDCGKTVVKDPHAGNYYELGPEEAFLLEQLDGTRQPADICEAFGARFGEALDADGLKEFIELASSKGFLRIPKQAPALSDDNTGEFDAPAAKPQAAPRRTVGRIVGKVLYWRTNFFDPDRFFN